MSREHPLRSQRPAHVQIHEGVVLHPRFAAYWSARFRTKIKRRTPWPAYLT